MVCKSLGFSYPLLGVSILIILIHINFVMGDFWSLSNKWKPRLWFYIMMWQVILLFHFSAISLHLLFLNDLNVMHNVHCNWYMFGDLHLLVSFTVTEMLNAIEILWTLMYNSLILDTGRILVVWIVSVASSTEVV